MNERKKIKDFISKLAKEKIIIPTIIAIEFIKIAGLEIGKDSAIIKLKLWIKGEAKIFPIGEEIVFLAGEMALQHKDVPIADIIIGAIAKYLNGRIVTDDPHFIALGVKTLWYK